MSAPISYAHSPFLYHHVPNSPFLLTARLQTQSPAPTVPDIDGLSENRCCISNSLPLSAREPVRMSPYPVNRSVPSPVPMVPSISAPSTPKWQLATPTAKKEQVVPNFSPLVKRKDYSTKREERRLDESPRETTVQELDLFSGNEIFA